MNIKDLLDISAICEAGSFRKAALVLGVTQPTLSNRVAHLEDQLGVVLFERKRGRSNPTAIALFIAEQAKGLLLESENLVNDVKRLSSGEGGVVRLGTGPSPSRGVLENIIHAIKAKHPNIALECHEGNTRQLLGWLDKNELDIVLCPLKPTPEDPNLSKVLLLEDELVIVAHKDHPLYKQPNPNISIAFQYPYALPFLEKNYSDFFNRVINKPQEDRIITSDYELITRLITSGKYVSAGPRFTFRQELESGTLRALPLPYETKHSIGMITHTDRYPYPAVKKVKHVIQEYFSELTGITIL